MTVQDHNSVDLREGDIVSVPCLVTAIHGTGESVNLRLETCFPLRPGLETTTICLSGHQVVFVDGAPDGEPCEREEISHVEG